MAFQIELGGTGETVSPVLDENAATPILHLLQTEGRGNGSRGLVHFGTVRKLNPHIDVP